MRAEKLYGKNGCHYKHAYIVSLPGMRTLWAYQVLQNSFEVLCRPYERNRGKAITQHVEAQLFLACEGRTHIAHLLQ